MTSFGVALPQSFKTERFISKKILTFAEMLTKTIKVSGKGQIAIPQTIRDKAGIKKGDELIIFESNGKILMEKAQKVSEKIKDDFRDLMKFSEQSLESVWENKDDDIWNSYLAKKRVGLRH